MPGSLSCITLLQGLPKNSAPYNAWRRTRTKADFSGWNIPTQKRRRRGWIFPTNVGLSDERVGYGQHVTNIFFLEVTKVDVKHRATAIVIYKILMNSTL